jgi:DNA polymerase (family 10)
MAARAQRALPMRPLPETLRLLAHVARIRGRQAEASAYDRVADRLSTSPDAVSDDDTSAVRDALAAIRENGPEIAVSKALGDVPADLRGLIAAEALSVAEAARIVGETAATTTEEVQGLIEDGRLPWLPSERREALGRAAAQVIADRALTPLGRAWSVIETLAADLESAIPDIDESAAIGRTRRYDAYVDALGLLVSTPDPIRASARLIDLSPHLVTLHAGPRTVVLRVERTEVTLRLVTPDAWPHALVWWTGSPAHLRRLAILADRRGFTLTRDGLREGGRLVAAATEADVYRTLGLPWIPPEMRETGEEVDVAEAGRLPETVRVEDIRGDLHMHSDWSDGRDSVEAMIGAAEALGYEYVAITDHSVTSGIARGLDVERLARQRDAIEDVQASHPGITILRGSEVDILPDGSLDFPDHVLESLDVVLASLHDPAGQDGATLTGRYVAAMRHPLVHIVTHPTNRLVPGREGYPLDETRFFDAAVETGTLVEIDGAPGHLDMDGGMSRRAIAAGVEVSVDGDCHRAEWLGRQMRFGVATARRGWVPPERVVNTRPLEDLRARLSRKRHT